jgi:hypothetical protein
MINPCRHLGIVKTEPQKIKMPKIKKTGVRNQEPEFRIVKYKFEALNPKS